MKLIMRIIDISIKHAFFFISAYQEDNNIFFITNENLPSERTTIPNWAEDCAICQNIILRFFSSILRIAEMHIWNSYTYMAVVLPYAHWSGIQKNSEKIGIALPIEKFISRVEKESSWKDMTQLYRWIFFEITEMIFYSVKEFLLLTYGTWVLNAQVITRATATTKIKMASIYWTLNMCQWVFQVLYLYICINIFHPRNGDSYIYCIMCGETEKKRIHSFAKGHTAISGKAKIRTKEVRIITIIPF